MRLRQKVSDANSLITHYINCIIKKHSVSDPVPCVFHTHTHIHQYCQFILTPAIDLLFTSKLNVKKHQRGMEMESKLCAIEMWIKYSLFAKKEIWSEIASTQWTHGSRLIWVCMFYNQHIVANTYNI